jgi:hypothetical protein
MTISIRLAFAGVALLVLNACSVGWRHTPDSTLARNFFQHEAEFNALLSDLQADGKLTMINLYDGVYYAGHTFSAGEDFPEMERLGLSKQRVSAYRQRLRSLRLVQVIKGDGAIEFRVDAGELFNGDSYKGYEYDLSPLAHPKASLDSYRISDGDKDSSGGYYVSKLLKGHWRLYLYVNG